MIWTFNTTIKFQFQRPELRDPTWHPNVRATDHLLAGTNRTQRSIHGTNWTLTGTIILVDDDQGGSTAAVEAGNLRTASTAGTVAPLSDGTTTWTARVDALTLDSWGGGAGYIGTVTFSRPEG
jgi:hypothetical protein